MGSSKKKRLRYVSNHGISWVCSSENLSSRRTLSEREIWTSWDVCKTRFQKNSEMKRWIRSGWNTLERLWSNEWRWWVTSGLFGSKTLEDIQDVFKDSIQENPISTTWLLECNEWIVNPGTVGVTTHSCLLPSCLQMATVSNLSR